MDNKIKYFDEAVDFSRMENCPEKVEIAISRLEYPLGLNEDMILMYQNYLFNDAPKIASQFIDLNKLTLFPLLVKYRVIKKANVLKLTEYARENRKMDMLSYLMDVGNQFRTRPKQMDIAPKFVRGKSSLPQVCGYDSVSIKAGDVYATLTQQEIDRIVPVSIDDGDDSLSFEIPEGKTGDKFFLLSVKEAKRYFRDNRRRMVPVVKYATRSMLWTVFDKWAHWWLRTPGELDADMFYVRDGEIMSINSTVQGSYFEHFGVRPAMYISME